MVSASQTCLANIILHARDQNFANLDLLLMQSLQPWGVEPKERLVYTKADTPVFEEFWCTLMCTPPDHKHKVNYALSICAIIHAAELGGLFAKLAAKRCGDIADSAEQTLRALVTTSTTFLIEHPTAQVLQLRPRTG